MLTYSRLHVRAGCVCVFLSQLAWKQLFSSSILLSIPRHSFSVYLFHGTRTMEWTLTLIDPAVFCYFISKLYFNTNKSCTWIGRLYQAEIPFNYLKIHERDKKIKCHCSLLLHYWLLSDLNVTAWLLVMLVLLSFTPCLFQKRKTLYLCLFLHSSSILT